MRLASVYSVEAEERGSSWFDPWWVGSPCRWLSGWMVPIFSPYLLCIIFPFSRKKKEKEKERNQCFSILDQISVASATPKSIKCCRGHQTLKAVIQKCPHCSRAHKHDGNNCKFWSSPPTPLPPNAFKSLRQFQKFVEKKINSSTHSMSSKFQWFNDEPMRDTRRRNKRERGLLYMTTVYMHISFMRWSQIDYQELLFNKKLIHLNYLIMFRSSSLLKYIICRLNFHLHVS